jgi:ankyrin repeat protein
VIFGAWLVEIYEMVKLSTIQFQRFNEGIYRIGIFTLPPCGEECGNIMQHERVNIFDVVEKGNLQVYKSCIEKFALNIVNSNGASLLHKAIVYQQTEIAIDLINRSINVNIQDNKGQSSLHYLGFFPNVELANLIIQNGGDLELKDKFGNTALWYAVFNARGNYALVELLIKNKAKPNLLNLAGKTALDFAVQIQDQKLVEILSK